MRCKLSPCPGLLHFELGKTRLAVEMRERSRQRATPKACVLSLCQSQQIWVPRVYRRKARKLFPSCSRSMRDWNVGNYDEISLVLGKQNITATQTLQSKRCSIFHHFQVPADIIGTLEGIHLPSSHSSGCWLPGTPRVTTYSTVYSVRTWCTIPASSRMVMGFDSRTNASWQRLYKGNKAIMPLELSTHISALM